MPLIDPIPLAGNPLDRAANQRRDPAWLDAQRLRPNARFLPLSDLRPQVDVSSTARLGWRGAPVPDDAVFLGLAGDIPHFAAAVAGDTLADPDCKWIDARTIAPSLSSTDAGIMAQARALVDWHARHGHCAVCGARTVLREGGYARRCTSEACKADHFPRTDPVVIMLVERDGHLLLGRQGRFPPGMYSALAGFMEPGETIEDAVRREVLEESGVQVGAVRYIASQPWPFPASLMIGCIGVGLSEAITVDPAELEEARWFTRDELVQMAASSMDMQASPRLSPPLAIAHQLVERWLAGA